MASSSNLNYSASKYTNNSGMKQTYSFPSYYESIQSNDDLKAKNWNLNQMRMNQSLKEFMKSINTNNKSTADTNLDITNLDEDESIKPAGRYSNDDLNENTLNSNSTTAEFRKYLEDLKKNYLEKLTFSCPSKLVQSASSSFDRVVTTNNNNVDMKLKSVENINNLIARKVSATPVTSFNSNSNNNININQARRSLFFDKKSNHEDIDLPINEKLDEEIKTEKMFETPELTKTQILSRLVQIREYLKQSYSMLSTLQTSNDLMNYASQMNKLHSLIDHLKDQEKGYLDLLNSFSKFQQLTTNIFPVNSETNINQSSKDILDLTDLNESFQKQQKIQQQQQNKILKEHASYLNNSSSSSSSNSNKSVAVQTCLNNNKNNISLISNSNKMSRHENEDSIANSLSGSFISDTLTLNGINSEINNPTKYNKLSKNKLLDFKNLVVIGKGYNKNEDDDNKTENDLDLLEYEDEHTHNDEKEVADLDRSSSIREQRREIMNALDSDLITLEQLKEQKKLLKSIRLRKEELKALEGRRKALEALQKIASESENKIDNDFAKIGNKSNDINSESDTNQESENKSVNKQHLMRKTFKHSNNNIQKDEHYASIEPSSQIEKSKKTVKHYEDLIKMKNSNEISLLKTCSPSAYSNSFMDDDKKNNQDLTENEQELIVKQELNKKMIDLAQNEKKLEELYSMQNKLAQLKEIIFDFNGSKQPQNELKKSIINDYSQNNDDEEVEVEEEDLNEHGYNYEITQKYFNLLAKNDADDDVEEEEEIDQSNQLIPDYSEDEDEKKLNTANREQLKEHKTKLASAKEKLKQLQDLISKLKNVSSSKSSEANLTSNKENQKETSAALEILNEIDKQKQQDRLDELKQNKQKLLQLLKQKENESAELARLYTSHHSSQKELNISTSKSNDYNHIVYPPNEFESAADENDLELFLKTSENQQQQQQQTSFHHSPSDLLWNQMKKQLNMRENLRSKKKELEDLIRDENNLDSNRTEKLKTDQNDNDNDDNKIINGYRDFFLQNKSNSKYSSLNRSNPNEEQECSSSSSSDTEDEEEIIMKRYVPNSNSLSKSSEVFKIEKKPQQLIQQQNICSTDELIKENYESNDLDYSNQNNDDDEEEEFNSTMKNAVSKKKDDETEKNNFLNSLSIKFNDLILNQQQLNESIQKNFSQLLDKSNNNNNNDKTNNNKPPVPSSSTTSNAYLMNSQFQFQTQMQVQQLMFNLNAAYHEIATQRSEMSNLNEQMKTINARLNELTSNKVTTGTNTHDDSTNRVELKNEHHSSSTLMTTTNALPSYFYNRKHGTNMEQQNKASSNLYNRLNSLNDTDCIKKQFKSYQISNDQRSKQLSYLSKLEEPNSNNNNNNNKLLTQQSSINYYTDDFEDCDEDNEEEKKQQKNRSRSSSNASSTKTNRSVDNTSNTNISIRSNSSSSSNLALKPKTKKSSTTPFWVVEKTSTAAAANESNDGLYTNNDNGCSSMTASQPQTIVHDGELFSFDKMREKIYSEVAALISQNEARPFFLLNLFRELQYLKDKNARDQALKSIFNINNRNQQFIKKDNEMTMRPKQKQQNIQTDLIPNNEQDDFISYKYRMTKSEHIYKETDSFKQSNSSKANDDADTSRTQSPFESDSLSNTVIFVRNSPNGKQPLKIKYPSKKNESDLQHKYQKNNDIDIDFSRSSSSSIMGIQESTNHSQNMKQMQAFDKFIIDQNKIENEVKNFISKIIKSIKVSDDNITDCEEEQEEEDEDNDELESNEDEDDDYISLDEEILNNAKPLNTTILKQSSSKNSYKFARCDSDYLNEIIDKVLNVLKQSSDHHDYLRLYQQQLTSYLKEALNKYENKRLIKCMEDILIDISDILYNELTFYSIMNHTNTSYSENVRNKFQQQIKMSRLVSKNIDIPSENNKFMTTKNVQTMDKSNGGDNLNLNLIKSLVRKNNQKGNFNREEVEEEDGDSSVASFQSKSNINTISSSNNMSRTTSSEQTSKSTSRTNSVDSTPALSNNDDTIYYFDENAVKTKLNCFKSNHKSDLTSKLESNYSEILNRLKFILNEKSEELTSLMKTSQTSEKLLLVNDDDDDDTKEQEINENEIKIEDLPDKLTIAREVALSTLDSIIMESISDGLVGDPNNLPLPQPTHEPNVTNTDINEPLAHIEPIINSTNNEKNSEDENELQHSNRSSSSKSSGNSDQFIMISETSNISSDQDQDQVLVDEIKKSDEETQSVNMLENITITELNEAN